MYGYPRAMQPAPRTKRLGSVVSVRVWLGVSVGYIESQAKKHFSMTDSGRRLMVQFEHEARI